MEFKGSKGPWSLSRAILKIYSSPNGGNDTDSGHEVCSITRGDWGDTYPVLRCIHDLTGEYKAETEMIVYGHTPKDVAKANARLISAAPELLETLVKAKNWLGEYRLKNELPTQELWEEIELVLTKALKGEK